MGSKRHDGSRRRISVVEQRKENRERSTARTATHPDARRVDVVAGREHSVENLQAPKTLQRLGKSILMRSLPQLHLRLAPTDEVERDAHRPAASQGRIAVLHIGIVTGSRPVTGRHHNQRVVSPFSRGIYRAADIQAGKRFEGKILNGVSIVLADFSLEIPGSVNRLFEKRVYRQKSSEILHQERPALLPFRPIVIFLMQPGNKFLPIGGGTAVIFISLHFVGILFLSLIFVGCGRQDVLHRLLERIGTNAKVGIGKHLSGHSRRVYFETHAKMLFNLMQHIEERPFKTVLVTGLS